MPDTDELGEDSFIWSPESLRQETTALAGVPWWRNYRVYSVLLLLLTASVVYIFR